MTCAVTGRRVMSAMPCDRPRPFAGLGRTCLSRGWPRGGRLAGRLRSPRPAPSCQQARRIPASPVTLGDSPLAGKPAARAATRHPPAATLVGPSARRLGIYRLRRPQSPFLLCKRCLAHRRCPFGELSGRLPGPFSACRLGQVRRWSPPRRNGHQRTGCRRITQPEQPAVSTGPLIDSV